MKRKQFGDADRPGGDAIGHKLPVLNTVINPELIEPIVVEAIRKHVVMQEQVDSSSTMISLTLKYNGDTLHLMSGKRPRN